MIWVYNEDRLFKTDSMRQALEPERETPRVQRPVISAVGAGGKKTNLHPLGEGDGRGGSPGRVTAPTAIPEEDRAVFLDG